LNDGTVKLNAGGSPLADAKPVDPEWLLDKMCDKDILETRFYLLHITITYKFFIKIHFLFSPFSFLSTLFQLRELK